MDTTNKKLKTNIEKTLITIWCEVLGVKHIDIQDNFLDLGGDSLKVTKAIGIIRDRLQVNITFKEFFSCTNILKLSKKIKEKQS